MRRHMAALITLFVSLTIDPNRVSAGDPPTPKGFNLSSPCLDQIRSSCQMESSQNSTVCEMLRGTRAENPTSLLDFLNNVMGLSGRDDLICARLFGTKVFTEVPYSSAAWNTVSMYGNAWISGYADESTPKVSSPPTSSSTRMADTRKEERGFYIYTTPDGVITFSDTPPSEDVDDLEYYQPASDREEAQKLSAAPPPAPSKRDLPNVAFYCTGQDPLFGELEDLRKDFQKFTDEKNDPSQIAGLTLTMEGVVTSLSWLWICDDSSCYYNNYPALYEYKWPHGPHSRYQKKVKPRWAEIKLDPCKITSASSTVSQGTSLQSHVDGLKQIMGAWFKYHMGEGPRPSFPPQQKEQP